MSLIFHKSLHKSYSALIKNRLRLSGTIDILIPYLYYGDMTNKTNLPILKCQRCGHEWISRGYFNPKRCPKCSSCDWNKPKAKQPGPWEKTLFVPAKKMNGIIGRVFRYPHYSMPLVCLRKQVKLFLRGQTAISLIYLFQLPWKRECSWHTKWTDKRYPRWGDIHCG